MVNYKFAYQRRFGDPVYNPDLIFSDEGVRVLKFVEKPKESTRFMRVAFDDLPNVDVTANAPVNVVLKSLLYAASAAALDYDVERGKRIMDIVVASMRKQLHASEQTDSIEVVKGLARTIGGGEPESFMICSGRTRATVGVNWPSGVVQYRYGQVEPGMYGHRYEMWGESPIGTDWLVHFNLLGETFDNRCELIGL